MLCGGLGRKALALFNKFGVEVFIGIQGTVQDALDAWKAGTLQRASMEMACASHDHHDHEHHHGHHHEHHHLHSGHNGQKHSHH